MVTLALVQGYWVAFKVWKNALLLTSWTLFATFSQNYYHIIANRKAFAGTYDKMTLTLVSGHWVAFKDWKMEFAYFLDIAFSVVLKLLL